jgi:NDP-sugar pyrophosphorylase family protein
MGPGVRQAVVLVGGRGTRLGSLTEHTPKPLLPVSGMPFLDWLAAALEAEGVEEMVLASGFRSDALSAWTRRAKTDLRIRNFIEVEPLGTGGALPLMKEWLDDVFVVVNGDSLLDVPIPDLHSLLLSSGADAAVALRFVEDVSRYGSVTLEGDRIAGFGEKTASGPGWINGGVYVFRRSVLEDLASPSSLESDLLPMLAERGQLAGLECDGFFIDIGLPETLAAAQKSVPEWWWTKTQASDG